MFVDSMKEKTILITGASSGIGKATALKLAKLGAHIILMARNQERGKAAVNEIKNDSMNPNIDLAICDLGSFSSIRAFSEQFHQKYDRLDVLINNAGLINKHREVTSDGFEQQFGINYLGHFLLTHLLLDLLKKSAPSRIINISSLAHRFGRIHLEDLQLEEGYGPFKAYAQSKLANVLFTRTLAEKLNGDGVTVNVVHPGTVSTRFGFNRNTYKPTVLNRLMKLVSLSKEKGANTPVYLATHPAIEKITGQYFARKKIKKPGKDSRDPELAQKLWKISSQLTGLESIVDS